MPNIHLFTFDGICQALSATHPRHTETPNRCSHRCVSVAFLHSRLFLSSPQSCFAWLYKQCACFGLKTCQHRSASFRLNHKGLVPEQRIVPNKPTTFLCLSVPGMPYHRQTGLFVVALARKQNRKKFLARKPLTSRSKSKRASPQEESIDSIRGRKGENLTQ